MDPGRTEELFAVVREALANVAGHAHASTVDVLVTVDGDIGLEVKGGGVGLPLAGARHAGHGLENMQARAPDLGGSFAAEVGSVAGTHIEWHVPGTGPGRHATGMAGGTGGHLGGGASGGGASGYVTVGTGTRDGPGGDRATNGGTMADLEFYFDPICPFAWMTSKWVRRVVAQRAYEVEWRFISLRLVNAGVDYASEFPPDYERGHTAGLQLLRVAAALHRERGPQAVDVLYGAYGAEIFDTEAGSQERLRADPRAFAAAVLSGLGLPEHFAGAADDPSFDAEIQDDTERALGLTGRDVGTPILHFDPPDGTALFGPVISRLPSPDESVALWDHVVALSRFGGFAELKRSLRERPQLRAFGVEEGQVGSPEDWQHGHRRDALAG